MRRFLPAVAIAATFCGAASAHHSYAGYDRCKRFTVVGEIERISWGNPHVVFTLEVDDVHSYLIQWMNPRRLEKAGLSSNDLKVGDRVIVSGSANRDPGVRIVTLVTAVSRTSDGWTWSRPSSTPESCGS